MTADSGIPPSRSTHPQPAPLHQLNRHERKPRILRGFVFGFAYLPMPEPGPVGVSVDPLGEAPAPIVLPEGFKLVFGPVAVGRAVLPVVPLVIDEPAVVPLGAGLPTAELPAAGLLPVWARANVLDNARAEASAMVDILMMFLSGISGKDKSRGNFMFPI